MSKIEVLNNNKHYGLKVDTALTDEQADQVNQLIIFPNEFENIQREFPILFKKDAQGKFLSVAILGLERNENLFVKNRIWQSRYVPAIQRRGPFSIGVKKEVTQAEQSNTPIIHIDLDHPTVNKKTGYDIFLKHGGNSKYLEHTAEVLRTIYTGLNLRTDMFLAFQAADIIEPMTLEVKLTDTEQIDFLDYYIISREKLLNLSDESLGTLHRNGWLQTAFYILASLGNFRALIDLKAEK